MAREMLTTLKEAAEVKFAQVDAKFKAVEDKVEEVEAKLTELSDGSTQLTSQIMELRVNVAAIRGDLAKEVSGVAERLTSYSNQLAVEQARISDNMAKIDALQTMMTKELQATLAEKENRIRNLEGSVASVVEAVKSADKKMKELQEEKGGREGMVRKSWKEFFDPAKMTVSALSDQGGWNRWKTDIGDLLECSVKGMAEALEESRTATEDVDQQSLSEESMWARRDRFDSCEETPNAKPGRLSKELEITMDGRRGDS